MGWKHAKSVGLVSGILCSLLLPGLAQAQSRRSFAIANQTGYTITALYLSPSNASNWGGNDIRNRVLNGTSQSFVLTGECDWDIRIELSNGRIYEQFQVDTCLITRFVFRVGDRAFSRQDLALDTASFSNFLRRLRREGFDDDKLEFLAEFGRNGYFTSAQVAQIVDLMTFSEGEEQAAILLYPRVVDPENWYVVYDALTFTSSEDEVRRALGFSNR
jgi:hypothetical protein